MWCSFIPVSLQHVMRFLDPQASRQNELRVRKNRTLHIYSYNASFASVELHHSKFVINFSISQQHVK